MCLQWYVLAATPEPKDVVIVIDTSGSMFGNRMAQAIAAGKVVLSTLSPNVRPFPALLRSPPSPRWVLIV